MVLIVMSGVESDSVHESSE